MRMLLTLLCLLPVALVRGDPCLIISEINADNPRLDTSEFVELYHTSGQSHSLYGYTLVFYNGNGNVAYKVLDLQDHSTDDRGFFLVGSVDMLPKPAILLPPNTVQNGPDAVVLYHTSAARYVEKMNVTAVGLVDAVVYMTRKTGGAEVLAEILTPGEPAFVEEESALEGDESIERCLLSKDRWGFRVSSPSPGQRNNCTPPAAPPSMPVITELKLGGGQVDGFVELTSAPEAGPLVLAVLSGTTDRVSVSLNVDPNTSRNGLIAVTVDKSYMKGDESMAVAIYSGTASDFPADSPLSQIQPLDSFVFAGPVDNPSANLMETLIPGREPYQLGYSLKEGGFYLSRCGMATWTRDPGVFWEAPQTPGLPNQCPWPKICPHTMGDTELSPHLPPWGTGQFVINELNTDTPGTAEDGEYVELRHPWGQRVSLQGNWILFFSAHNNKPYKEICLTGHFTTAKGYFLLGSDRLVPAPSLRLPPNTIQNGPGAVALYHSPYGPPSVQQRGFPTRGLLDAVVYRKMGSDQDALELTKMLTPGQLPLLEDPEVLSGDEALSRCKNLDPYDLSAFSVAPPTPLRENSCPRLPPPSEGVVINEVASAHWTNHSRQRSFVEFRGPPLTELRGLVLVVFDQEHSGSLAAVPLTGSLDRDGFYVVGNVTGADQTFPEGGDVPARGSVLLCYDVFSVCSAATALTNSSRRDELMFSDVQLLLTSMSTGGSRVIPALRSVENDAVSLSRCMCCVPKNPSSWTTSLPTPRSANNCPSSAFSSHIDICVGPPEECSELISTRRVVQVVHYLEQKCLCGISFLSLQEANFSCESGWTRVRGNILAFSDHQRALIIQTSTGSLRQSDVCSLPTTDRHTSTGSSVGLQIGVVVAVLLLLAVGVALLAYFYKRRRPQDYATMELSEHGEGLSDL
ncbi:uncharacterized protein si:ch211-183d21.1 [Syngnathoides biaculeatus]|uniref:uncharacterized protein si:ch211-183d21.1 n=1 Tax=Syngnathoides biaculeatus TaxID=300417 RepID=UPI002ADDF09B|nr:uncharacterized protein si:ch211-183d21.1 [Syngnathoides biaculeatus]